MLGLFGIGDQQLRDRIVELFELRNAIAHGNKKRVSQVEASEVTQRRRTVLRCPLEYRATNDGIAPVAPDSSRTGGRPHVFLQQETATRSKAVGPSTVGMALKKLPFRSVEPLVRRFRSDDSEEARALVHELRPVRARGYFTRPNWSCLSLESAPCHEAHQGQFARFHSKRDEAGARDQK